jgi:cyclic pyranopterin phosphate synthase
MRELLLTVETFVFEEPNPELVWIPLAVRRALDLAGIALSLEAWQGLRVETRRSLITLGARAEVDLAAVEALLADAAPPAGRIPPRRDPALPDAELLSAAGSRASELEQRWPALSPLARYALVKLAHGGRKAPGDSSRRLASALEELLPANSKLSHLNQAGEAHMVDVSEKSATARAAVARASVRMLPATLELLRSGNTSKGDVLAVARIAGIQAAKRTPELIPLCHAVRLTGVELELRLDAELPGVAIEATARCFDRTGVEMEALVAASVASLTLYDMLKAVDRGMTITNVELVSKSGGRSGDFRRPAG